MKTCSVCAAEIPKDGVGCARCGVKDATVESSLAETGRQAGPHAGLDAQLQVALGVSALVGAAVAWFFRPASVLLPAVVCGISVVLYFRNSGRKTSRVAKSDWVALLGESTLALLCAAAGAPAFEAILLAVVAASAFLLHVRARVSA